MGKPGRHKDEFIQGLLPHDYSTFTNRKGRVFITGDRHGNYEDVERFCEIAETTRDDALVVLGDNGVNYYGEWEDRKLKKKLKIMPITFIMIRGNHDMRPPRDIYNLKFIQLGHTNGNFWVDDAYPNILLTQEFGWYYICNTPTYVIGGAYSADKYYRLMKAQEGFKQYKWFPDEQLSDEEKKRVERDLLGRHAPWIMSHTCPKKYIPVDMFLPNVDQNTVDDSMEEWLDTIEERTPYEQWFCGHWHIDRIIDKMRFMYHSIIELSPSKMGILGEVDG